MCRNQDSRKMQILSLNKKAMSAKNYCSSRKTRFLYNYMEAVLKMEFDAEPYYDKLKFMMIS